MKFVAPFAHCPECEYSLLGLPLDHRCPECGLVYNGKSCYWSPTKPWKMYSGIIVLELVLLWQFGGAIGALLSLVLPIRLAAYTSLLLVPIVPLLTWLYYRLTVRKKPFVALLPDGIRARTTSGTKLFPWDEISIISVVDVQPWIKLRGVEKGISLRGIFDNKAEKKEFKAAATQREMQMAAEIAPLVQ